MSKGVVNILGKVTTIMHKTVQTFEDTVEVEEPVGVAREKLSIASRFIGKPFLCSPDFTVWTLPSRM